MFGWLLDFVGGSAWAYPAILGIVAVDAFFPILPGETSVVTGAILAANGQLAIEVVFAAAVVGAIAGDNFSYFLGDTFGDRAQRRVLKGERARRRTEWARAQLHARGPWIIVAARFVPGGRTAATFSAGALEFPWRRFIAADLAAAAVWSGFTSALGWFGGNAYKNSLWEPFVIALAAGLLIAGVGELYRRATER